jgi:hypothetical protein
MKKDIKTKLKKYSLEKDGSLLKYLTKRDNIILELGPYFTSSPYEVAIQLHKDLKRVTGGHVSSFDSKANIMYVVPDYLGKGSWVHIVESKD